MMLEGKPNLTTTQVPVITPSSSSSFSSNSINNQPNEKQQQQQPVISPISLPLAEHSIEEFSPQVHSDSKYYLRPIASSFSSNWLESESDSNHFKVFIILSYNWTFWR